MVTLLALAGQLAAGPRLLYQYGTSLAPLRHKFVPVLALPGHFDDRLRSLAELGIRPALRGALPLPSCTREQARNLRLLHHCGIDSSTPTGRYRACTGGARLAEAARVDSRSSL